MRILKQKTELSVFSIQIASKTLQLFLKEIRSRIDQMNNLHLIL